MANRPYDAVLHLGDYIYEYAQGGYANPMMLELGRNVQPENEIVSIEDYRMRYGLYRTDEDLQAAHQNHPFICVWDDHEITNNTWQTGAENHNEGEGPFDARRLAAIQAYHEWLPIRDQGTIEEGIIYRSFEFGDLATLIMLDTRSIMGTTQESWLASELQRSAQAGKPWQIVGQQLLMGKLFPPQVSDEELDPTEREAILAGRYGMLRTRGRQGLPLNLDAWDGYPVNRSRALQAFRDYANNVVVLAGDTHSSWAFDLHADDNQIVAVEFGTPSVTSPGFENFLALPEGRLEEATMQASPELKYMKANGRGWVELDVQRDKVRATWLFVSTITDRSYAVEPGATLETLAGNPAIHRV